MGVFHLFTKSIEIHNGIGIETEIWYRDNPSLQEDNKDNITLARDRGHVPILHDPSLDYR